MLVECVSVDLFSLHGFFEMFFFDGHHSSPAIFHFEDDVLARPTIFSSTL